MPFELGNLLRAFEQRGLRRFFHPLANLVRGSDRQAALDRESHLTGGSEALLRMLLQTSHDHRIELRGQVGYELSRRCDGASQDGLRNVRPRDVLKEPLAGQSLPQ